MKNYILLAMLVCFPVKLLAGDIYNAKVTNIMLDEDHGLKAYIELNKDLVSRDDASCHKSGRWEYVLDISTEFGEKLYSNLLITFSAQIPATFFGSHECLHYGIEGLRRMEITQS